MKVKSFMLPGLLLTCLLGITACNNASNSSTSSLDQTSDVTSNIDDDKQTTTDSDVTSSTTPTTSEDNTTTNNQPTSSEDNSSSESLYDLVTVSELLKIGQDLQNDEVTTTEYYCKGVIEKITDPSKNAIMFKDATGSIFCYRVNGKTTIEPALKVGEELILKGGIKKYSNKPQFNYPQIIERHVEVEPPLEDKDCTPMNLHDARNSNVGSKVKVTGIVAIKTKTQQYKDNGFYLIDETGSIYVHSSSLVNKVNEGNKITILGLRENYKGQSETNADKHGYQGAIQLVDPVLVSNDNKTDNVYDTSWIKETTIKDMIDTPLSNNITSLFYKVKAFVKKSSVNNNTILVINDIDNKTGAIVYSCNKAGDFSWLMPYDGKLVELLVSAHNVNVTESSYNYRLQPLKVLSTLDNYSLNDNEKGEYIAKYHIAPLFRDTYTSDPSLELPTTFTEALWNIDNASIRYASDNENVVKIENNVLHCLNNGTANITISVKVNEITTTKVIAITFNKVDVNAALNVKQAIEASVGSEVKVKGIVSSKIANKDAVYITDETGTIAISLANGEDLKDLHIGDEVIFKGTREFKQRDPNKTAGQSHIYDSSVLVNNYGNHEISTAAYVNETLANLKAFTEEVDHTTTVYTINVKVNRVETPYSTNTSLIDNENNTLLLYSGKASDYAWLAPFADKGEIQAHVMLCDWNQKGLKGAVLSVTCDGVTTYNDNALAK